MPQPKFCPDCKADLKTRDFDGKSKLACPSCPYVFWNNPLIVVVGIIPSADGKKLVLEQRGIEPKKGLWAHCAGYLESFEHPEDGLIREAFEELGINVEIVRLVAIKTVPHLNQVFMFYLCKPNSQELKPKAPEVLDAKEFGKDDLPDIAFSTHREIVDLFFAGGLDS